MNEFKRLLQDVLVFGFAVIILAYCLTLIFGCAGGGKVLWADPMRQRFRIYPICPPDDYVCKVVDGSLLCHPEGWEWKRYKHRTKTPLIYGFHYRWYLSPSSYMCPDGVERFDPLADDPWPMWCLKYGTRLEECDE